MRCVPSARDSCRDEKHRRDKKEPGDVMAQKNELVLICSPPGLCNYMSAESNDAALDEVDLLSEERTARAGDVWI